MNELVESKLLNFNPSSEDDLLKEDYKNPFYELAEAFLYGGYISVKDNECREWYRIYIRTVEFYCHYEGSKLALPKDPIVYHRNNRYIDGPVPYFPLMAFHAHASGIDITFEKEDLELRSSALIRAYEVCDVHDVQRKIFLTYDKETKRFVECRDEKKRVNQQSTYIYDFMNGFKGNSIEWIDSIRTKSKGFKITTRKNVYKYEGENKTKDDRKWSYTRLEDLKPEDLKQEDKKMEDLMK